MLHVSLTLAPSCGAPVAEQPPPVAFTVGRVLRRVMAVLLTAPMAGLLLEPITRPPPSSSSRLAAVSACSPMLAPYVEYDVPLPELTAQEPPYDDARHRPLRRDLHQLRVLVRHPRRDPQRDPMHSGVGQPFQCADHPGRTTGSARPQHTPHHMRRPPRHSPDHTIPDVHVHPLPTRPDWIRRRYWFTW